MKDTIAILTTRDKPIKQDKFVINYYL